MATSEATAELMDPKSLLRRAADNARNAQPDKDEVSRRAVARLMQLPHYRAAHTLPWFLVCRLLLCTTVCA